MRKKLNFGCGIDIKPKNEGWTNIDITPLKEILEKAKGEGVTINTKNTDFIEHNLDNIPYPLKENTFDYVYINASLEYLEDIEKVLNELWRICKDKAIIEIFTPHYTNVGSYNDFNYKHHLSHKAFEKRLYKPEKRKLEIIKLKLIPTKIGKIMPESLRNKLSYFVNGLISSIHIKLMVIKSS